MPSPIISHATELLLSMYNRDIGLFSSSTRVEASSYQNDYTNPSAFRYSAVSLMGLQRAFEALGETSRFAPMLEAFAKRHWSEINSIGDLGVLSALLNSIEHPLYGSIFRSIEARWSKPETLGGMTGQEIFQLLIAVCEIHGRHPSSATEALAFSVRNKVRNDFCSGTTGFPFHNSKWYRRPFVSFGAISYYLRALHDFGRTFGDDEALQLYHNLLKRIVVLQGPRGEWPWFFNTFRGQVAEWYEIYSVHQHAMAFLFLFPALAEGQEDLAKHIQRSYQWIFGQNELGVPMIQFDPFFIYRSIRRREAHPQLRRFVRGATRYWNGQGACFAPGNALEINTECRSYEIGWLLYVWSEQTRFEDFQSLKLTSAKPAVGPSVALVGAHSEE